jgi:hypothetical protein
MGQRVVIEKIKTNRVLDPDDDITALAQDIKDKGLAVPLLVDTEYQVIDGLRRLEALRTLGVEVVEVEPVSLYDKACLFLTKAREHGVEAKPLTARRIWEIYQQMSHILLITRSHVFRGKRAGTRGNKQLGGRKVLVKALGLRSESYLQVLTQVYRVAENGEGAEQEKAKRAVHLLENEGITVYTALGILKRTTALKGDLLALTEQRAALTTAVSALRGLQVGLDQMGTLDKKFPQDELRAYAAELDKARQRLARFIRLFKEEINSD